MFMLTGPPTVDVLSSNLTLNETDSHVIAYNVAEGIPPSGPPVVTFNGVSFTNNARVNISNTGVQINNVTRNDAGIYRATWSNDGGSTTYVLMLKVNCELHFAHCAH